MRKGGPSTWISLKDVGLSAVIPAAALFAWSVPEAGQERFARRIARLRKGSSRERAELAPLIQSIAGADRFGMQPERIVEAYFANVYLMQLITLRYSLFGDWRPATILDGRAHIDSALAAGKGAILWSAPSTFVSLPRLYGLSRVGFKVCQLAGYAHGFSTTKFGRRVLNQIVWKSLSRVTTEILLIGPDGRIGPTKPLDVLAERLRANQLVCTTASKTGRRTATIPLFNGTIRLATGPLALAQRTGAAILPGWTVREPDGTFKIWVGPPLDVHDENDPVGAIQRSLASYAAMHERYVSAYPDQFNWRNVTPCAPEPAVEQAGRETQRS